MKQKNLHHTDPNLTLGKRYFLWFVEDLGEFEKGNCGSKLDDMEGIEIDMCVYIYNSTIQIYCSVKIMYKI